MWPPSTWVTCVVCLDFTTQDTSHHIQQVLEILFFVIFRAIQRSPASGYEGKERSRHTKVGRSTHHRDHYAPQTLIWLHVCLVPETSCKLYTLVEWEHYNWCISMLCLYHPWSSGTSSVGSFSLYMTSYLARTWIQTTENWMTNWYAAWYLEKDNQPTYRPPYTFASFWHQSK